MIRKTLPATKDATFCIELPHAARAGMPTPTGTGFFVSADGWFLTAAHVVADARGSTVRSDVSDAWLMKEGRPPSFFSSMCQHVDVVEFMPEVDVALLKIDWEKNKEKGWLKDRTGFPFLIPSALELDEGAPVYSFGYPLSDAKLEHQSDQMVIGSSALRPRVTSAIVASTFEESGLFMSDSNPRVYVLDKALNYGKSGVPSSPRKPVEYTPFAPAFSPCTCHSTILRIRMVCQLL